MRKTLIEVALPLDAINQASAQEKPIRHGHPSALHLWWARRPLAAARAVIFAQLVDDPSSWPEEFPTEAAQEAERQRLEAHASDLNPVAVLINKAMFEIPPKFAGMPPVNPEARAQMARDRELGMEREWKGTQGV